jgi:hypothetical protein
MREDYDVLRTELAGRKENYEVLREKAELIAKALERIGLSPTEDFYEIIVIDRQKFKRWLDSMTLPGNAPRPRSAPSPTKKRDVSTSDYRQEAENATASAEAAMKAHPYADVLPLLEGEAFDSLVADIRSNGLLEPITIHHGMILDGRNRYRACEAAGIKPQFLEFDGHDPLAFVLSLNVHRRTSRNRSAEWSPPGWRP